MTLNRKQTIKENKKTRQLQILHNVKTEAPLQLKKQDKNILGRSLHFASTLKL